MRVIAETLALVVDTEVLARMGGTIGEAAREKQRELAKLDEKTSRTTRASWLAAARVPIPAGLRGMDPSWIERAIARVAASHTALAAQARRVLLDGPTTPGDVWIARSLCAAMPAMPAIDERIVRPRSIGEAQTMSPVALRVWLEDVGADQIAFAVGKAATAVTTKLGSAAVRITQAPRLGQLGERRAAIERAKVTIDDSALVRVGARAIAPHAGPIERCVLAHRLPHDWGLLGEMDAFAGSAGPSWRALAAP